MQFDDLLNRLWMFDAEVFAHDSLFVFINYKTKEENQKKEITVVNGDGSDLNISPVYDHISSDNNPSLKKSFS